MDAYCWTSLTQVIPVGHRYVTIRERVAPMLAQLELKDEHMLWMMVLQIGDRLSETKLLKLLPENYLMRWLCGYGLCDEIAGAEAYREYKRSIRAFQIVCLIMIYCG